jgi:outer membrane protein OmpA-like peptidoglycan-associated protein
MKTSNPLLIAALAFAGALSGCVTTAPAQLVEARAAYETSSKGIASKLTPTELYDAKKVLDKAEIELTSNGDTLVCRDYAYIALRKIALADVKARTEADRQSIAEAVKAGVKVRDTQVKNTQAALSTAREQLVNERRTNAAATSELSAANTAQARELEKSASQLEVEKQARLSAEAKLDGAMKDLAAVAAVKEEARGLVITLSGSVLFASGKHALLNTAMTKLDQVAEALKAQDSEKRMTVEGHTDNTGSDATNQTLSLNRAEAVRDYLVGRGVDSTKITAVGLGSRKSITDNKTAPNRANNRRVEIVIGSSELSAR